MLLKKTNADLSKELICDCIQVFFHKFLEILFIRLSDRSNRFIKKLFNIYQTVLVHWVNLRQFNNWKVD